MDKDNKEKIPCSVAILSLNCRDKLKKCLETLCDFEEIVVLDGNSTDGTPELAREMGAKVYPQVETEEKNVRIANFSAMRMRSFSFCSKDWIFEMDADEYITPELSDEIRGLAAKNNPRSAALIPRLAMIGGKIIKHAFFYPNDYVRVFHKASGIGYNESKVVHEELTIPEGIDIVKFRHATLAPWPPYAESLVKDNNYLAMAMTRYAERGRIGKRLKKIAANILKAGKICCSSLVIYLRYGFADSLPPGQAWRFARYHLALSWRLFSGLLPAHAGNKPAYDSRYSEVACPEKDWIINRTKIFNEIYRNLDAKIGEKILEIGCDDGLMQKLMAEKSLNVTGIDINKEALEKNICENLFMSADNLRFPDESFDKIYSSHTVEHIGDLSRAFKEVSRVLKNGGLCVLVYPWELFRGMAAMRSSMKLCGNPFMGRRFHLHKLSPKKFDGYLADTGLKQVRSALFFGNTPQYITILKKDA